MMKVKVSKRKLKILDFDIEARPLSWIGGDFCSREVTAVACKFIDEDKTYCWLLGKDDMRSALQKFVTLYDAADIVTGHYIRNYDLPNLNAALTEMGLNPLKEKLTHDTKNDLVKKSGTSNSQESLAAMLGLEHEKIQMTQADWREANRLTKEGIEKTRKRVVGDVNQHIELRAKLLELNMLGPPKLWKS